MANIDKILTKIAKTPLALGLLITGSFFLFIALVIASDLPNELSKSYVKFDTQITNKLIIESTSRSNLGNPDIWFGKQMNVYVEKPLFTFCKGFYFVTTEREQQNYDVGKEISVYIDESHDCVKNSKAQQVYLDENRPLNEILILAASFSFVAAICFALIAIKIRKK